MGVRQLVDTTTSRKDLEPSERRGLNWSSAFSWTLRAAWVGFSLGVCEGALLLFFQNPTFFYMHMVGPAILFLAPFVDAVAFGVAGGILCLVTGPARHPSFRTMLRTAVCVFVVGAYASFLIADAWMRSGNEVRLGVKGTAAVGGVTIASIVGLVWLIRRRRHVAPLPFSWPQRGTLLRIGAISWGAILLGTLSIRTSRMSPAPHPTQINQLGSKTRPNIILIALDTARADHFSGYGYSLPTTPNIDNLAKQGVLFENAVAPAPWTLPSFGSVFTGLLPHQHALGGRRALPEGFLTLASILRSRGYHTAGFNANYTHGTPRTGLAQGFDFYDHDDASIGADLTNIGAVKAFWSLFYYPFVRPDTFMRRNAGQLNQSAFRWLRYRPPEPFFLFLNYFDPHEPYSGVPAGGNRFGDTGDTVFRRIRNEFKDSIMGIELPQSPAEQAQLISRYDDALAYVDSQVGELLHVLEALPEWANTYVILFSDHGQALGDHQSYGHLCGVNWELLHVALIIKGPGAAAGQRVTAPVGIQQLFATIIDLSRGGAPPPERDSLSCYWRRPTSTCNPGAAVVSEFFQGLDEPSFVSLVTQDWQLISESTGARHLYRLSLDPREERDLATTPGQQKQMQALQAELLAQLRASSRPWPGDLYLAGLGEQNFSILTGKRLNDAAASRGSDAGPDRELLQSLPYQ